MKIYSAYKDTELTSLLMKGDQLAFAEIYNRYWDKLFAVAYHRCEHQQDAEEVVQDVFFSLWKRRSDLDLKHSIHTYLAASVKYQVINKLAKHHRRELRLEQLASDEASEETTDLWMDEKELRQQLQNSIQALPEKCRIVFLMSREEGKSIKQIAEELNISTKTVEAHMTKALRDLRNTLNIALPMLLYLLRK